MILIDNALQRLATDRKVPLRIAMIGAGFMARGVLHQMLTVHADTIRIVGIANRTPQRAVDLLTAEKVAFRLCDSPLSLRRALASGDVAVTEDPVLLASADGIDLILDVTGAIEDSLPPVLSAIEHGKHVVLMNAELDGTVGPILKRMADAAGVVFTNVDGDQPGVEMNLWRFVRGIGLRPVLCGNIKGLHDPHRTPATQADFARRWGQKPEMVTSFADGTKISFEQAIVANATGMTIARRGMLGYTVEAGTPITEAAKLFDPDLLLNGPGIVDYITGASPGPGVFVIGTTDDPVQRHYLDLYKLGSGPLYCFYTPYHLCHFEVPNTIARAILFRDAACAPLAGPMVEVVATAKRDLKAGDTIDGLGGFDVYGLTETAAMTVRQNLLPVGVAVGCRLKRAIPRDQILTYADVERPAGRLVDMLRDRQSQVFPTAPTLVRTLQAVT